VAREVSVDEVARTVARLCQEANYDLGGDVRERLRQALETEESPAGREILELLMQNADLAAAERVPMCQDTGLAVVFLDIGQEVSLVGGDLTEAVNEGVRRGYREGYLRKSMVEHPLRRKNTGDNTPAVLHTRIVPGDRVRITVAPKGGGSENMSALAMLKPADGEEGVIDFVVGQVERAGPNPCPPVVVGVGIGGNFEMAALLAKRALLRPLGQYSEDPDNARLEREILRRANNLGIGPQGFGGRTTALWVSVETHPAHIVSLPVAVNLNCHAARHKEAVI